ncbi:MAG: DNA repair protein RadC [Klebsiella michiganensis]|nr:DNA repair protein RadC [Klebsiella michiganensis]
MERFCDEYSGGIWSFYTLSNGGAFMAPDADSDDKWHLFNSMNGNGAQMSAEAAGIAICLIEYSHHACRTECDAMTEHYYRLRDYALQHPEQSLIPQAPALPLTAQRTVKRALTLLDRHLRETGVAFTSTQAARDWLKLKMAGLEREEFMVLYLNQQNQLIAHETLFAGSISSTEVHPREVVKRALYFNAAAVILAHNHPSGDTTPSQADKTITQRLVQALQLVDIRVPDHLIVGGTQILSFAEHGLL